MKMADDEDKFHSVYKNDHNYNSCVIGDHDYFIEDNANNKILVDGRFVAEMCPGFEAKNDEDNQPNKCQMELEKNYLEPSIVSNDGLESNIELLFSLMQRLKQINQSLMSISNSKDTVENNGSGSKEDLDLPSRDWPWIDQRFCKNKLSCIPMTAYDEEQLLNKLFNCIEEAEKNKQVVSKYIYLMYRRLCIRKLKRERNLKVFNFDEHLAEFVGNETSYDGKCSTIVDKLLNANAVVPSPLDNILSTGCYPDLSSIVSLYTNRSLKPFIWCDPKTKPPWLKMLNEIEKRRLADDGSDDYVETLGNHSAPICYTYLRPEYMTAINNLCSMYFWPGIDLSESLQYPDFSCVALYKKLIIGFAFMVPDVTPTDCYISFLLTRAGWRNCGVGTFMLYHLIQSCMGKDITLHVAADNSSLFLYQKFGFKVEQFVKNYYEKYLPVSSSSQFCKHALFLRLSR